MLLLLSGFPCQPFSGAGVQRGLADAHAYMWGALLNAAACACHLAFFLERVIGLTRDPQAMQEIVEYFTMCGFKVSLRRFSAHTFSPQIRDRVFIMAIKQELHLNRQISHTPCDLGLASPSLGQWGLPFPWITTRSKDS